MEGSWWQAGGEWDEERSLERVTRRSPGNAPLPFIIVIHSNDDAAGSSASPIQKFDLGRLVATPGALQALPPDEMQAAIRRHVAGDWGSLDKHDMQMNEAALRVGGRLFSVYESRAGVRFYVITEADRSATTVLLPEEY